MATSGPRRESGALAELPVPPSSIQAEQALLGGLMLDNSSWDRIADLVGSADFFRPDHRLIFAALRDRIPANSTSIAVPARPHA